MIKFKSVSLRNFLSYGNNTTVVLLERLGTTLILGENTDSTSDGKGGNGVGKTTIVNAIVFALYDRVISGDITKDELINNINKRNLEVSVEFSVGTTEYMVRRERKAKEGNNVYLYINGEDKTPDSAAKTNAAIIDIVGMPFEMFVRIVVFSAQQKSFLELPVRHPTQANQTDFIEELFGLTTLSTKADMLKLDIAEVERAITAEKARISMVEQELSRHNLQIDATKKRLLAWEASNELNIANLQQKLGMLGGVDVAGQQILLRELKAAEKYRQEIIANRKTLASEKTTITSQIATTTKELESLKHHTCPYCLQDYADAATKSEKVSTQLDAYNQAHQQLVDDITVCTETLVEVDDTIADIKSRITVDNIEELIQINAESGNIAARISELQQEVNPHFDALDDLINANIATVDYDVMNALTEKQEHQKFLLKLLTKKDSFVRKELLDTNIPYLNARLQHHLSFLGLPHKVEFTKEMTASISQFGQPLGFGNLSAGQRARVNIALSLAFRDVLQQLHQVVNICMFDEVLDVGLDGVGIIAAAQLLKRVAKDDEISMFIISHKSEVENMFDSTITVQLSKGFSYIKDIV